MTAAELAATIGARRTGKGKWTAKCPAHADRSPSLAIAEGRKGVVLKCMSQGCDTRSILDALGLQWSDLFRGSPTKEIRGRVADERRLERLDRKFGLVLWLLALERRKSWHDLAVRIGQERRDLREKLNPKLKAQREFQERVKRLGWDQVLTDWMETGEGKHVVDKWGIYRAGSGSPADAGNLREDSVHREPHQLPDGGLQWREGHRGHMGAGD